VATPKDMKQAVADLKEGRTPKFTVRQLLGWYGWERRGKWIVKIIRRDLAKNDVETSPDFESVYIDATVSLRQVVKSAIESGGKGGAGVVTKSDTSAGEGASTTRIDPAHRISRLKAAITKPIRVAPTETVDKAVTLMLLHDFSQLPIMTSERDVKGMISWRSLGRKLALGKKCETVQDCSEPHHVVPASASMFDVIVIIAQHDVVLVRDDVNIISGIVTAADVNDQFRALAEPFLLLGDIETSLRHFIEGRFNPSDLVSAKDPDDPEREVESAGDLTFGEYLRLLEKPANWSKLRLGLDRKSFISELDNIRQIRNDVMHFDPDGIDDAALESLRRFAKCLDQLQSMG